MHGVHEGQDRGTGETAGVEGRRRRESLSGAEITAEGGETDTVELEYCVSEG